MYIRDIGLDVLAHSTSCGISPTLGMVMKLDRKIRDLEIFDLNSSPRADATQPVQAMVYQRNIMFCIKESALSYLHRLASITYCGRKQFTFGRPFFISALNENHADPLRSKFAGSVLAVYVILDAISSSFDGGSVTQVPVHF